MYMYIPIHIYFIINYVDQMSMHVLHVHSLFAEGNGAVNFGLTYRAKAWHWLHRYTCHRIASIVQDLARLSWISDWHLCMRRLYVATALHACHGLKHIYIYIYMLVHVHTCMYGRMYTCM